MKRGAMNRKRRPNPKKAPPPPGPYQSLREYATARQESGPVKTWAEMTPEQRQRVMAQLKPSGTR